ncbi:hypothetical protein KKH46_00450 [Patescibacteria group bacterium]|nr:hypothetical protein [Patescibacteria group bacterium]MBU1246443.1 hypothetical protein [Patescibacteria group bacterium]MBU1956619.1 hypothetical protein [Patescibacteria group bacterium]MBU2010462.1 hypothetical protein [Patescibacteria group bacterium]
MKKDQDLGQLVFGDDEKKIQDPIRMYLSDIGKIELLTPVKEVAIAKRIERGEEEIEEAVFSLLISLREIKRISMLLIQKKIDILKVIQVPSPETVTENKKEKLTLRFHNFFNKAEKEKDDIVTLKKQQKGPSLAALTDNLQKKLSKGTARNKRHGRKGSKNPARAG